VLTEIETVLAALAPFEVICVDDGSTDATAAEIAAMRPGRPWLRNIRLALTCGKAAAIRTGVRAARAEIIVTMDGDGQNDPAFVPLLVDKLAQAAPRCGLVAGQRLKRKASIFKRLQSRIANGARARILRDGTRDTACGFKCYPRGVFNALPYFDNMHRFMPALVRREGYAVAYVDVVDRPRIAGVSNYGFLDRLRAGLLDLIGVRWLLIRAKRLPEATEIPPP
jgi:dolichol-phosphate mannosyltransferase